MSRYVGLDDLQRSLPASANPGKVFLKQETCLLFKRKVKKKKLVRENISFALWILKTETGLDLDLEHLAI